MLRCNFVRNAPRPPEALLRPFVAVCCLCEVFNFGRLRALLKPFVVCFKFFDRYRGPPEAVCGWFLFFSNVPGGVVVCCNLFSNVSSPSSGRLWFVLGFFETYRGPPEAVCGLF